MPGINPAITTKLLILILVALALGEYTGYNQDNAVERPQYASAGIPNDYTRGTSHAGRTEVQHGPSTNSSRHSLNLQVTARGGEKSSARRHQAIVTKWYSPLRNKIARVASSVGATAVNWKRITGINTANLWPGVAENTRAAAFNTTGVDSKSATFVSLGFDDYVGFEALAASKGFEDVRATAALNLLYSVMIGEEKVILGGQSTDIGAPTTLAGATSTTSAGALVTDTYYVYASALTLRGYEKAEKSTGTANADGESLVGSSASITINGALNTITATWTRVKGAVAYNVFTKKGAAAIKYHSTVTVNSCTIITQGAAGTTPNTSDETGSALEFTGIIGQIAADGTVTSLDNASLTSDTAGGITEIDTVLKAMWDSYRLGPTQILVNSQQAKDITTKIGASSALSYRVVLQDGQKNIVGGIYVGAYLNKFASSFAEGFPSEVPIRIHPNLPAGTMIFLVEQLPYPNNQVPNVWEIETRQEYTQYEWALTQRMYEFGIYSQEVLKGYFPAAQTLLVNVKAG
jgi:hypothetical protein